MTATVFTVFTILVGVALEAYGALGLWIAQMDSDPGAGPSYTPAYAIIAAGVALNVAGVILLARA